MSYRAYIRVSQSNYKLQFRFANQLCPLILVRLYPPMKYMGYSQEDFIFEHFSIRIKIMIIPKTREVMLILPNGISLPKPEGEMATF